MKQSDTKCHPVEALACRSAIPGATSSQLEVAPTKGKASLYVDTLQFLVALLI
ncbi:MAG: hypothetical protein L0Y68_05525 [Candidatus Dadabacteria bacterium]|nr:hypothetical protein [Candidatus Dadabacteria bacterium]